jgi:hypothetical protein
MKLMRTSAKCTALMKCSHMPMTQVIRG